MRKDTQEALEWLEQELLAEEQKDDLPDEDLDLLVEGILFDDDPEEIPATVRAYNTDRVDVDLDRYSDEVYEAPKKSGSPMIFFLILLALLVCAMYLWVVKLL